ncbi:hypothetical protein [Kocuria aegyptia]|uniref:DUF1648 domain-containing protein n=1 Tax=Kocuria aegyptia TaxID=330943 RepID=A0ABN2K8N5_9MICC
MKPDRSLLWWGLVLTGVGAVIALAVPMWLDSSGFFGPWSPYPMVIGGAAWMLLVCGVLLLAVDGLLHLAARRRSPPGRRAPRSLRRVALLVTVISGGITVIAGTVTWVVEKIDYMHPAAQVGWLAFPAGLVAAGGLITLLGDALRSTAAGSSKQETAGPHRPGTSRSRAAGRMGMLAFAVYLLVAALGLVIYAVYLGGWSAFSEGLPVLSPNLFLLLCAAVFLWAVWRPPRAVESPRQQPPTGHGPDPNTGRGARSPSTRQWALAFTGGGAGIAVTMLLAGILLDLLFNTGVAIGLGIFYMLALPIAAAGLLLLLIGAVSRRTARRH